MLKLSSFTKLKLKLSRHVERDIEVRPKKETAKLSQKNHVTRINLKDYTW